MLYIENSKEYSHTTIRTNRKTYQGYRIKDRYIKNLIILLYANN